jgi:hypothetical protein
MVTFLGALQLLKEILKLFYLAFTVDPFAPTQAIPLQPEVWKYSSSSFKILLQGFSR